MWRITSMPLSLRRVRILSPLLLFALASVLQLRETAGIQLIPPENLTRAVGTVQRKCCKPGRRMGCDPANFRQTGCVSISRRQLNCVGRGWLAMPCTTASCVQSNPEHRCSVDIHTVRKNACRPTGESTTVDCPDDQWQCKVDMIEYTHDDNPEVDVLICDHAASTICAHNYSECD